MAQVTYGIKLSGAATFLWRADENAYKGLEGELGVDSYKKGKPVPKNGVYGGNKKPPKVTMQTTDGYSYVRFIDPKKIPAIVYDGGLIGEKVTDAKGKSHTISYVSVKSS